MKKLAVIFCTFNRREKTEKCIHTLINASAKIRDISTHFYICDDMSSDGTQDMILGEKEQHGNITLLATKGNFYWSKSMYIAFKRAREDKPDYYLMVNDDVEFYSTAIELMIDKYNKSSHPCGIVGTLFDVNIDGYSYGGRNEKYEIVAPKEETKKVKFVNWNCFLVDEETVNIIGLIDGKYEHAYGDYDYSLRMSKKGIPIYVAEDVVGTCSKNTLENTYMNTDFRVRERLKLLFSPKGRPFKSTFRYHIKNYGVKMALKESAWYIWAVWRILRRLST